MKHLDAETLLQWAYNDELPKRGTQPFSPWDRLLATGRLGAKIEEDFRAPGLPPALGDVHPDALAIARSVGQLPHRQAVLVTVHARQKGRPTGWGARQRVFPVMDGSRVRVSHKSNGTASNRFWRHIGKPIRQYPDGAVGYLRFEPTNAEIAQARLDWALWRGGLVALVAMLTGRLASCEPIGPALPAEPWLTGLPERRILYSVAPTLPTSVGRAVGRTGDRPESPMISMLDGG